MSPFQSQSWTHVHITRTHTYPLQIYTHIDIGAVRKHINANCKWMNGGGRGQDGGKQSETWKDKECERKTNPDKRHVLFI